jgi:hypothetical protein
MASWIILFRVMGLVVPMPDVAQVNTAPKGTGTETTSLLRSGPVDTVKVERPKVGWGRIVAGEAFKLGDDEEEV